MLIPSCIFRLDQKWSRVDQIWSNLEFKVGPLLVQGGPDLVQGGPLLVQGGPLLVQPKVSSTVLFYLFFYFFLLSFSFTDGLKGLQVKMFVPVDVSMDSTTNIFTYYKMINLKIFGRALFELWLH